jgi:hypothetical protein
MSDQLVKRLRELWFRFATETEDDAVKRRNATAIEAADRIEALESRERDFAARVSEVVKLARSRVDEPGLIEIPAQAFGLLEDIHAENLARRTLAGDPA